MSSKRRTVGGRVINEYLYTDLSKKNGSGELVKLHSQHPIGNLLHSAQMTDPKNNLCDTHIICEDGYIPCHRFVLMAQCPYLRELMVDAMSFVGIPSEQNLLSIVLPDFKVEHVQHVLSIFYSGKAIFDSSECESVSSLLDFLKVNIDTYYKPATSEDLKGRTYLRRYVELPSSDDEEMPLETRVPDSLSKVKSWQVDDTRDDGSRENLPDNQLHSEGEGWAPGSPSGASSGPYELEQHGVIAEPKPVRGRGRRGRGRRNLAGAALPRAKGPLRGVVDNNKLTSPSPIGATETLKSPRIDKASSKPLPNDETERNEKVRGSTSPAKPVIRELPHYLQKKPKKSTCLFCSQVLKTDRHLSSHFLRKCGSEYAGKYSYSEKTCHNCDKTFPSHSLAFLLDHVVRCYEGFLEESEIRKEKPELPVSPVKGTANSSDDEFVVALKLKPCVVRVKQLTPENVAEIKERLSHETQISVTEKTKDDDEIGSNKTVELPTRLSSRRLRKSVPSNVALSTSKTANALKALKYRQEEPIKHHKMNSAPEPESDSKVDSDYNPMGSPESMDQDEETVPEPTVEATPASPPDPEQLVKTIPFDASAEEKSKIYFSALCICNVCHQASDDIFKTTDCLSRHQYRKCWVCMKILHTNMSVNTHYQTEHGVPNTSGILKCPICESPQRIATFIRHMNTEHLDKISSSAKTIVKPFIRTQTQNVASTPVIVSSKSLSEVGTGSVATSSSKRKPSSRGTRRKRPSYDSESAGVSTESESEVDSDVSEEGIVRQRRRPTRGKASGPIIDSDDFEVPRKNLRQRKAVKYDESAPVEVDQNAFITVKERRKEESLKQKEDSLNQNQVELAEGTEIPLSELSSIVNSESSLPTVTGDREKPKTYDKKRRIGPKSRVGPKSRTEPKGHIAVVEPVSHVELSVNPFTDSKEPDVDEEKPDSTNSQQVPEVIKPNPIHENSTETVSKKSAEVNPMAVAMRIRNAMKKAKEKVQESAPSTSSNPISTPVVSHHPLPPILTFDTPMEEMVQQPSIPDSGSQQEMDNNGSSSANNTQPCFDFGMTDGNLYPY